MRIVLFWIGKTASVNIQKEIENYKNRVNKYLTFEIREVPLVKNSHKLKKDILMEKESEAFIRYIQPGDVVFLLDEKGRGYSSTAFASFIQNQMLQSVKRLVFVIGGAYGHGRGLKKLCNGMISFSGMTFSHQIIRLMFMEQIYRANTIIRNEPYHNS